RLRAEHGLKALRYCGVSIVNVTVGLSVLAVCHGVLGWPAVGANLAAWMVGTGPAYLLSRAWVWQRSGPHRLGGEVVTFWIMALAGLALSSSAVAIIELLADSTVLVLAANLGAYGSVWVAKYIFLDRVMWPRLSKD
ncbi:MAG: GtrA family protein, partial [Acidimicrobiaceae bacterium]|nr:GtrA family protein [Acidimicrobiaceae bacterium]